MADKENLPDYDWGNMVCCDKPMTQIQAPILNGVLDDWAWVCFECGRLVRVVDEQLNEDELENYIDNYKEDNYL